MARLAGVATDLLDAAGDPIAVQRPQHIQSPEHHQRQCSLQDICFLSHSSPTSWFPTGIMLQFLWESNR